MNKETVRPQITAYESILLILSEIVKRGKTVLSKDMLVSILYSYRDVSDTQILFGDIVFKDDLDMITSVDIEDSLIRLQTFGVIGKLNPAYEKFVVYIGEEEAGNFINYFGEQYVTAASIVSRAF